MSRPPLSAILGAILAFGMWGALPVYWKQLGAMGADIGIAQRTVWTMLTVLPLLAWQGQWGEWMQSLRSGAVLRAHAWSALLLGINWTTFVWATQHGHILDCSLGYFINPLLNVAIGGLLLGERFSPLQKTSVAFAATGVAIQIALAGRFPWIGLLLAFSFAFYALARRRSSLGSLPGLAVETLVGLPVALVFLAWMAGQNHGLWGTGSSKEIVMIIGLGVVTAIPLLGFANGARKLPFALLGLLQFIAPTGQFIVGSTLYHEPVSTGVLLSFALIWTGVALFCLDLFRARNPATK